MQPNEALTDTEKALGAIFGILGMGLGVNEWDRKKLVLAIDNLIKARIEEAINGT